MRRARVHAALGEPHRLAIAEQLALSDRSPTELGRRLAIPTNLLAHHLDVLDEVGLVERFVSSGDRRRRYVRLVPNAMPVSSPAMPVSSPATPVSSPNVVFVCSQNSARSQLAAAIWRHRTGRPASSAGTHPADRVHPGAIAAAARCGLDLGGAHPAEFDSSVGGRLVVTVCDQAHEELDPADDWWHWSTPDPVAEGTPGAFDRVVDELTARIIATGAHP